MQHLRGALVDTVCDGVGSTHVRTTWIYAQDKAEHSVLVCEIEETLPSIKYNAA